MLTKTYQKRKETIERVFADAKEKHAMRYTHMRGLTRVKAWVGLKFAAMNLKKMAIWAHKHPFSLRFLLLFHFQNAKKRLPNKLAGASLTI